MSFACWASSTHIRPVSCLTCESSSKSGKTPRAGVGEADYEYVQCIQLPDWFTSVFAIEPIKTIINRLLGQARQGSTSKLHLRREVFYLQRKF